MKTPKKLTGNVVGIIAEYNPFHKGHEYHVNQSKIVSNSDYAVVVMSGNYVQRGYPALFNKYFRTKLALLSGADMVLELPLYYATSSSEIFASGSINTLNASGIVDNICFGSESGDINKLINIARILSDETPAYKESLKNALFTGLSYPVARQKALELSGYDIPSTPNDILGIEYLKSIIKLSNSCENLTMNPYTIKRNISQYHDDNMVGTFSSATAIRKVIDRIITDEITDFEELRECLPVDTYDLVVNEIKSGQFTLYDKMISNFYYSLSLQSPENLREYMDVTEGLEYKLKKIPLHYNSFTEVTKSLKSKRYTYTKISRMILHCLLQLKKSEQELLNNSNKPPYIRVLGFRRSKQELLSNLIDNSTVPVVTNLKNADKILDKKGSFFINKEIISTDIYNLMYHDTLDIQRELNYEYKEPMVIVD